MIGSSSRRGRAKSTADDTIELVGRQPAVRRRFRREVGGGKRRPFLEVARGDEHLAHLPERRLLGRQRPLDAVAERGRGRACRSRTSFRMPSGMSENAWSVPFIVWLSVKCFSITRAPSM